MDKENPEKQRQEQIIYGREILARQGINPDDYKDCFQKIAEIDVPLINSLPAEPFIRNENDLIAAEETWHKLLRMYSQIDLSKQDQKTGKTILEEMQALLEKFDTAFKQYATNARVSKDFSFPAQLAELKRQIVLLARRYSEEVPAYVAYRWVGRFEIDPEGRRGYQIREDQAG